MRILFFWKEIKQNLHRKNRKEIFIDEDFDNSTKHWMESCYRLRAI